MKAALNLLTVEEGSIEELRSLLFAIDRTHADLIDTSAGSLATCMLLRRDAVLKAQLGVPAESLVGARNLPLLSEGLFGDALCDNIKDAASQVTNAHLLLAQQLTISSRFRSPPVSSHVSPRVLPRSKQQKKRPRRKSKRSKLSGGNRISSYSFKTAKGDSKKEP